MSFAIADTFQKALAWLTADEQAVVKQAAFDFQLDPKNPGFSYEDLIRAKGRTCGRFAPRVRCGLLFIAPVRRLYDYRRSAIGKSAMVCGLAVVGVCWFSVSSFTRSEM